MAIGDGEGELELPVGTVGGNAKSVNRRSQGWADGWIRMDFFTQTVDSSLWASRAFDDEGYEGDADLGELCAATFELKLAGDSPVPTDLSLLVCTEGAPASFATAALKMSEPIAWLRSEKMEDIPVRRTENVLVISTETAVSSERCYQLAATIFRELKPKEAVILSTCPSWKLQVSDEPTRLFYLKTKAQGANLKAVATGGVLPAPGLVEGIAAACINECQYRGTAGCVIVGTESSVRLSGISLSRFGGVVESLLTIKIDQGIDFASAAESQFNPAKGNIYI